MNKYKEKRTGFIMKCGSAILLALLVTLIHGIPSFAYNDMLGTVLDKGAIIRAEASTTSELLASVSGGKTVTICGEKIGDDTKTWYLVYVTGTQTGYIRGDLITNTLKEVGTTTPDTATNTVKQEQVTEDHQEVVPVVDCTLATLSINQGTLEPEFSPEITQYTITVPEDVSSIAVFGVANDINASVIENTGFTDLELGASNGAVTVKGSDETTLTYHFTIIRGSIDLVAQTPKEDEMVAPDVIVNSNDTLDELELKEAIAPKNGNLLTNTQEMLFILMGIIIVILILIITFMAIQLRDLRASLVWDDQDNDSNRHYDGGRFPNSDISEDFYQAGLGETEPFFAPRQRAEIKNSIKPEYEPEYEPEDELEDELEDIREREATESTDQMVMGSKDAWKPLNFLTPEEDLEFEFLDLDEEDK